VIPLEILSNVLRLRSCKLFMTRTEDWTLSTQLETLLYEAFVSPITASTSAAGEVGEEPVQVNYTTYLESVTRFFSFLKVMDTIFCESLLILHLFIFFAAKISTRCERLVASTDAAQQHHIS